MVIIAYRLAQGWAGPGGFTIMTGRVPPTVYFKPLWLSHPAPYLVNTQSWSHYLHPDKVCTNTSAPHLPNSHCQQPHLHLLHPLQPQVFLSKLFLYHISISHGDQYRCNSLGLPKSACLQAFAHITAIDPSRFGPVPTSFSVCTGAGRRAAEAERNFLKLKLWIWFENKKK